MTVSRQSEVNAGEKTRTFLMPLLGRSSKISSENGVSQFLVSLD